MVMSGQEIVTFVPQASIGSAILPSDANGGVLVPVIPGTFRATPNYEQILDRGRRGPDAMDFQAMQGVGFTEITWEGYVQLGRDAAGNPKTGIGYLLANLLGADGVAPQIGATGSYDHKLHLGTEKAYFTVQHDSGGISGANDRQWEGCRVTEIVIRWNVGEGPVTYRVTMIGRNRTLVTAQTPTDYNADPWRGWHCIANVNGANTRVMSGEWTLRRAPSRFYGANNVQNYADLYLGPLEVTCSLVLDYSVVTDLTLFHTHASAEEQLSTLFRVGTEDATSEKTFAIGAVNMDFGDGPAELDSSEANVKLGLVCRGLYTTSVGPFSSTGNAATAQNGPVEIQIVQANSGIYDISLGTT